MAHVNSVEFILSIAALFMPCLIILLLLIREIDTNIGHQFTMSIIYSKKQKCFMLVVVLWFLWFLSLISLNILHSYFNIILLPLAITSNVVSEYISWSILIISAFHLQMTSNNRYFLLQHKITALAVVDTTLRCKVNVVLFILYTIFAALFVCIAVNYYRNDDMLKYIIYSLYGIIILLSIYLIYHLYFTSMEKLICCLFINERDAYMKKKNIGIHELQPYINNDNNYTDTLFEEQIELLLSGYIKQNIIKVFIPTDIIKLIIHYIWYNLYRKSSMKRILNVIPSFKKRKKYLYYEESQYQRWYGFTRKGLIGKKMLLDKLMGICMFIFIIMYCVKFILSNSFDVTMGTLLIIDIGLYVCIWIDALCNCLLMPSNHAFYKISCCICLYWAHKKFIKDDDIQHNNNNNNRLFPSFYSLSPDLSNKELRHSFDEETNSYGHFGYGSFSYKSFDGFKYTSNRM